MLPYRYYKDKVDIIAAVRAAAFRRFAAELEAPRSTPRDTVAQSRAVGDAYVAFAFAHPHLYRLMFDMAPVEPGRYPELDAAIEQARGTMTRHVEELVRQGFLTGEPEIIGHVFWASLHGLIVLQLAGQLAAEPGFEKLRAATLDALVNGLRSDLPRATGV
jgi:AcrR family transcriptional regulator